jgi:hypothetical protein
MDRFLFFVRDLRKFSLARRYPPDENFSAGEKSLPPSAHCSFLKKHSLIHYLTVIEAIAKRFVMPECFCRASMISVSCKIDSRPEASRE